MTLQTQNQTEQSAADNVSGLPADFEVLFSNHKNIYKPSVEKRQRKLFAKISFLSPFLDADEKILLVTTGCSPIPIAEQLLTGWIVFYLKRALFVFTNKRIFHIPTTHKFEYRGSIAQIFYADCKTVLSKGSRLIAKYKTGQTEKFPCLARSQRKKIRLLLENIPRDGAESPIPQRTHLCPKCTNLLTQNQYNCPHCHLPFKSKSKAVSCSIIFPGGGYFYTRHPLMGIGDAIAEVYLTALVLLALFGVLTGAEGTAFLAFFVALILAFEKLVTVYHAGHFVAEFIPLERNIIASRTAPASDITQSPEQAPAPEPEELKPEQILRASWRTT